MTLPQFQAALDHEFLNLIGMNNFLRAGEMKAGMTLKKAIFLRVTNKDRIAIDPLLRAFDEGTSKTTRTQMSLPIQMGWWTVASKEDMSDGVALLKGTHFQIKQGHWIKGQPMKLWFLCTIPKEVTPEQLKSASDEVLGGTKVIDIAIDCFYI